MDDPEIRIGRYVVSNQDSGQTVLKDPGNHIDQSCARDALVCNDQRFFGSLFGKQAGYLFQRVVARNNLHPAAKFIVIRQDHVLQPFFSAMGVLSRIRSTTERRYTPFGSTSSTSKISSIAYRGTPASLRVCGTSFPSAEWRSAIKR